MSLSLMRQHWPETDSAPAPEATKQPFRTWILWASASAILVVLDLLSATTSIALALVSIGSVAAIVIGVRRHQPAHVWTWWTVISALVLFTFGGVRRDSFHTLGKLGVHRSIIPDLITVPGYLILAVGLFGFVRARARAAQLRLGIIYDGLMAGLAMLACTWVWVIEPVVSRRLTPLPVRTLLVCYPALSVFLMVITLQIAFGSSSERTPAERYLIATMVSMSIGDTLYMLAEIHVLRVETAVLDLPYLFAYIAAAACALEPSMRGFTQSIKVESTKWSFCRLLLIAVAFTVPALLVLQSHSDPFRERFALFVIIIALTSTAILQIVQALRAVERSEAMLRNQALHDSLTGLPNRRSLLHHLSDVLSYNNSEDGNVGLLFIDLDQFKLINDTLGHSRGDDLLIEVARRLQANVRAGDLVTRIGGDEFVIVLARTVDVAEAREFANRLRHCLQAPFAIGDTEFFVTASIGLACSPNSKVGDAELLIRDADTAMYRAKEAGRDAVAVFDESMRAQLAERVEIGRDLRHAVPRGQLHLVYQPIVRMPHGEVVGVEALVRWAHPTLGVLLPTRFIPVAEESTQIIEIGNWVLEESLRELSSWRKIPGFEHLEIAVNLSAVQFGDEQLVARTSRLLKNYGLPGKALCFELTESEMMRDPAAAIAVLSELSRLDVKISIDDFGTEYSSLAYLHRFPVDVLKIDRSFVENLRGMESPTESLISAIIAMAKALNVETIAEGIETSDQAAALHRLGCTFAQGYLYARPTRSDQILDVIRLLSRSHHGEAHLVAG